MQNTTNQIQNLYTQPTIPSATPQSTRQTAAPKKGNNIKQKQLLAVVGLVLFAIVAAMGILIAQKQIVRPGEDVMLMAPTAPESKPAASTYEPNNCVTIFNVPAPVAECISKVAQTNYSTASGTTIPAGSKFNIGDEFVFSLSVKNTSNAIVQNAKLVDDLPKSLEFVSAPNNSPYSIVANGQTVTATIPQLASNTTTKVEFKVRVIDVNLGSNTNSASVDNPNQTSSDIICSYNFVTVKGNVECVDKLLYNLQGKLVGNNASLVKGQRYEYRVTAKAINRSIGDVKIHDILPKELKYIGPASGSSQYITNDPNTGILIANLGVLEDESKTIGFIVEVPDDLEPTKIFNKALVYSIPNNSRQEEPPANADECSISHTILPTGIAECVEKEAFTDFSGTEITPNSALNPGDEFVYKVTITADQTTTGPVVFTDVLHRDLTFIQDAGNTKGLIYNAATRVVSLDLGTMTSGQTKIIQFKVQLSTTPVDSSFKNIATVTTEGINEDQHTCEIALKVKQKTYSCNSECQTNENCTSVNSAYICYDSTDGKYCRLASNPTDTSCRAATPTPSATPTPTPLIGCNDICTTNSDCMNDAHICVQTATGYRCRLAEYVSSPDCKIPVIATTTPTPAPLIGCNDSCTTNSDCMNNAHICVQTATGYRCRLAEYTNSSNCTIPAVTQPILPKQLLQTGPEDWLNWLKAGLVTLGIGTALFLLL